jgi:hypothetical protein
MKRNDYKVIVSTHGTGLDVEAITLDWIKTNPVKEIPTVTAPKPKYIQELQSKATDGAENQIDPIAEFNKINTCHDVLIRNNFTKYRNGYLHKDSTSGIPSVYVMDDCKDGIERIYSHGGNDLNDGYAHDAFDCYRLLEFGGNWKTALNWNPEITKANQIAYKKAEEAELTDNGAVDSKVDDDEFSLDKFVLNGQSKMMFEKMSKDTFVFDGIALKGQHTHITARANVGKTALSGWLLRDAIQKCLIDGSKIYYINADDNQRGLATRLEFAEQNGFKVLSPGYNGFESDMVAKLMKKMTDSDTANDVVIILDTITKFVDQMSKTDSRNFMKTVRQFTVKGGTVITLGHANKYNDSEGKPIPAGTADVINECDCAYLLYEISKTSTLKNVLFENTKSRGDVKEKVGFSYNPNKSIPYIEMINSIQRVDSMDDVDMTEVSEMLIANLKKEHDQPAIECVCDCINQGHDLRTKLLEAAYKKLSENPNNKFSQAKLEVLLSDYAGVHWVVRKEEKNAKRYYLI